MAAIQNHRKMFIFAAILAASISISSSYKITLDDLLIGKYVPTYFSGTWISDEELAYQSDGHVMAFNARTSASRVYINGSQFDQATYPSRTLQRSGDGRFVLITHSARIVQDVHTLAKYHVHDLATGTTYALNPPGHTPGQPQAELELVLWSPSTSSNALAYVYDHNIYYQAFAMQGTAANQLTTDGNSTITNGRVTWVFAEDIFGSGSTMGFSPDGSRLAYLKFDETPVPEFKYLQYGEPGDHGDAYLYPEVVSVRFPKAGAPNGILSVHVADLTTFATWQLTYPAEIDPNELHYCGTAHWRSAQELVVMWLTRRQQDSNWFTCNVQSRSCRHIWSESEPNGWINMNSVHVSRDGTALLTPSNAMTTGSTKSYRHVIKLSLGPTGPAMADHWDPLLLNSNGVAAAVHVDDVLAWDQGTDTIYFMGNTELDASEQHIYSVQNVTGSLTVHCLTCEWKNSHGEDCIHNRASFTPTEATYMFHSCLGPGVPDFAVRNTKNSDVIQVMEANVPFREMLADAEIPPTHDYFDIPLASGYKARARLYLPPDFDPDRLYPLLVEVYAGPETQFNTYGFEMSWFASLSGSRDVVYARIDGSASARQSREQFFRINNRLGTVEVQDQIEATRWLVANTGFIDANRTAIWGWSNGGYVTSMVMGTDTGPNPVFKCGIAKAPATSYFYTASITTERYMGMPTEDDNLAAYEAGEVSAHIEGFRSKEYLLIHGNADVNAHYQHSMKLLRALEQADIMFTAVSYPEERHAIDGPGMTAHQYHLFERFLFRDCFGTQTGTDPDPDPAPTTGSTDPDPTRTSTDSTEDPTCRSGSNKLQIVHANMLLAVATVAVAALTCVCSLLS